MNWTKYIKLVSLLMILLFGMGNQCNNKPEIEVSNWESPLTPKGPKGTTMVFAKNGQAKVAILLPEKAEPVEEKAAEELAHWLGLITNAEFRIINEPSPSKDPVISIGNTRLYREKMDKPVQFLNEGYAIEQADGHLFLNGGAWQGPLHAVYALLEEDLGCRWYTRFWKKRDFAESIEYPVLETLAFQPILRKSEPAFAIRELMIKDAFRPEWAVRNGLHPNWSYTPAITEEWGGQLNYPKGWQGHTFNKLLPRDTYFQKHPEYFSELNGKRVAKAQLCLTNEAVFKIALKKTQEVLRANPDAELFSISQNDGGGLTCTCSACSKVNRQEGAKSGTLIRFVNRIAKEISSEFSDVRITTLAYKETYLPPKTRPHDNILVQLCTDVHWPNKYLSVSEGPEISKALDGWADLGANLIIWDYAVRFKEYLRPLPNMQVLTENLRTYRDKGVQGVLIQGNFQSFGASQSAMRTWVWSKLLWNPDLDTKALIKDFTYGYYEMAGELVYQYNLGLWELWEKQRNNRSAREEELVTLDLARQGIEVFTKAQTMGLPEHVRQRVDMAKLAPLYLALALQARSDEPIDEKERKAWKKEFEKLWEKTGMERMGQGNQQPEEFFQTNQIRSTRGPASKPNAIVLTELDYKLLDDPEATVEIIKDPLAGNGFAIQQTGASKRWLIRAQLHRKDRITKNKRYRVLAYLRGSRLPGQGGSDKVLLRAGVYNNSLKKYESGCLQRLKASDLSANKYTQVELGVFELNDKQILLFTSGNDPGFEAFYIDRVELIPEN